MENVIVVVASFADEADLARFCFYIDFETRPDFEDEVPEHEQLKLYKNFAKKLNLLLS